MIHMTTRTIARHGAALALFALALSPRDAVASSFSLSSVNVGTGIVSGGGPDTITSAASVTSGAGHLASANTKLGLALENPGFVTRHLRGGAKGATTGTGQIARAEATVQDAWNCPNCVFLPPVFPLPMSARIAFDGVLDPLIALLIDGHDGTDESSLDVFFRYTFPDGEFRFEACYEAGDAFVRAELGCAKPLEATFDRKDGTHFNLTNDLVLGVNGSGQKTVAFNKVLPWVVAVNNWDDSMSMVIDIRNSDSAAPHLLNFFNTFAIEELSSDPNRAFTSALGRTSTADVAAAVPEPATGVLLLTGLLGMAAKRRRNRCARRTAWLP